MTQRVVLPASYNALPPASSPDISPIIAPDASALVDNSFLTFAARHGLALLKIHIGSKRPVGDAWQTLSSKDPAEWALWKAQSFNIGIHAGASNLATADIEAGRWDIAAEWFRSELGMEIPAPHTASARDGRHIYFRLPDSFRGTKLKKLKFAWGDLIVGNSQTVAPDSYYDGTAEGKQSGHYRKLSDVPPYPAPATMVKLLPVKAERPASTPRAAALPVNAERAASTASDTLPTGYSDPESVGRWIDRKVAGDWKDDPTSPWNDQGEWIFLGKTLKLHFPNEDGFALWMRATHDGCDIAAKRWNDARDFKPDYIEGMRTLKYYLGRDTAWIFEGVAEREGARQRGETWSPSIAPDAPEYPHVPPEAPTGPSCDEGAEAPEARRSLRDRIVNAASLAGKPVPKRQWLVPDWIPMEQVTLLYGDGATGKSLKTLQLCAAGVTGTLWFGMTVKQGRYVFITAEDSEDELHRRMDDISRESGLPLEDMSNFDTASFADEDTIMAALNGDGKLVETDFYREVVAVVEETRPTLLVLDTLADIFGGNEIIRGQARAFINMLRKIAIKYQLAVVVLAHPSLDGMKTGKGTSGNTGWSNSVRSRLYDERVYDEDGVEPDTNARRLSTKKINYGPANSEINLRYQRGVFVVEGGAPGPTGSSAAKAERVFLELLERSSEHNVDVSGRPQAKNYAPKSFATDALKQGVKKRDLAEAMGRLLQAKKIENALYGAPSRLVTRLQRIDVPAGGFAPPLVPGAPEGPPMPPSTFKLRV
jgi:RecA-family ATPase